MTNTSRNRGIGIVTANDSQERSKGQLHIYDGEGKGKSQAALGVVLRTIGLGICEKRQSRVLLLRFLKGPERSYDEDSAIEALQRGFPHLIDHVRTGRSEFFNADQVTKSDIKEAERGWNIAKGAIASSLYSVVVLDELNPVLDLGMLNIEEVVNSLQNRPDGLEIIITGRAAPSSLIRISQLHSEMRPRLRVIQIYQIEKLIILVELKFILAKEKVNLLVHLVKLFKLLVKEYLKIRVIEF